MMDPSSSSSLPGATPSVGELSAAFAKQKRAKSPPLAFEKTPNDALVAPVTSPPRGGMESEDSTAMGSRSPLGEALDLQIIVDQQADAISKLHDAFATERQSWMMEKERLYQRIASLERLLRSGDGYSPAKSPVLSPFNGGSSGSNLTSPQSKASASSNRLPSIAEDENTPSSPQKRDVAPEPVALPAEELNGSKRSSSVGFAEATPTAVKVEEIPVSPPRAGKPLSPPPMNYRMQAGHTPMKARRPPTPPPHNSMSMDGVDDTPTRNNTHINTLLTQSRDDEEDEELKGPLNMPELPHLPDETNFTFDMLSKKLMQIEKHPEELKSQPMVFSEPSPGLASPAEYNDEASPNAIETMNTNDNRGEEPMAPPSTISFPPQGTNDTSDVPSNTLSPSGLPALSKEVSREDKVQSDFESGGIKLKKKASVNFGAPFGQLSGFGGVRKTT